MTADPAWVIELSKAENDALRVSGDVDGIVAKYAAAVGAPTWNDAPLSQFLDIVGNDWIAGLTEPQRDALFNTHTNASGEVTLSNSATRTAINPLLSAQQQTDVTAVFQSPGQKLYESLGLANVGRSGIEAALREISDTPQYDFELRKNLLRSIRAKAANGGLEATSTANLQTIEQLVGV